MWDVQDETGIVKYEQAKGLILESKILMMMMMVVVVVVVDMS